MNNNASISVYSYLVKNYHNYNNVHSNYKLI